MSTGKKLYRSYDRIIGGVCSGLADYFDIDPTIMRVGYALLTFFTGFCGIPLYIILWIVMPPKT
ncbi:MAG: PspC domain-containing protein [Prevotella sp.]|nr:PspC domain-containing protein [Prevotella sp.]MBQ6208243.1 PspC domain-containing protein [Prevotella sp.]